MKRARLKTAMVVMLCGVGVAWSPTRAIGQCCGDCDGDGVVAINELVTAVNRALGTCQDDGVCDASVATCAAQLDTCTTTLTTAQANLDTCTADLSSTQGSLATCTASLTTCDGNLTTCSGDLGTCSANYTTCSGSLAICNAGTAGTGDVLSGKTFSSGAGLGGTGTMPDNGAVSITPGTTPQPIAAGYHNGAGSVAGDADLTAANVKLGVDLFGVTGTLGCGDGAINAGEECDQNNLNGATCVSLGYAFGELQCGADCAFDTTGCYAVRFTDNGDGTVSDAQTGLMWEQKGALDGVPVVCASAGVCPDPHDADNQYTYSADNSLGPPGTAFTVLLAQLNAGGGFAGHTDWRLPTRDELQTIADYADASSPVVPAVFDTECTSACAPTTCGCTAPDRYWTDDLVASISGNAWILDFSDGSVLTDSRDTDYAVRAVR